MDFPKSVPSAGLVDGKFIDEDALTGTPGSLIPSAWGNAITLEVLNVIEAAGLEPDEDNNAQLIAAIRLLGKQPNLLTDTGAVNAYTAVNTPALSVMPTTGYLQKVKIANANTGASTYAPDGLAAKPIYGLGLQPLQGGELPAGVAVLMYLVQAGVNSGNGAWILIESLGGAVQVTGASKSLHAVNVGQIQTQARTAFTTSGTAAPIFTLTPTPALTAYAANQRFRVRFGVPGVGNDVLNVSGLGDKSLKQYDSAGNKVAAVITAGLLSDVEYDGVDWVLLDPLPAGSAVPSGFVLPYAANVAPTGWLKANGAAVSRTTYASLFAAISTTFGAGDGATTFNLPDLRAEVIRGWDDSRGIDIARTFGSLQLDAFQGHWHVNYFNALATIGSGGNTYVQHTNGGGNNVNGMTDVVRAAMSDGTNGTPRTAAETRSRNVALLYCIKI